MATVKATASALLGTVTTAADTVTSVIESVAIGAQMLQNFATDQHERQLINIKIGRVGYEDTLKVAKTIEIEKSRQTLEDYIGGNTAKRERCDRIWAQLEAALA